MAVSSVLLGKMGTPCSDAPAWRVPLPSRVGAAGRRRSSVRCSPCRWGDARLVAAARSRTRAVVAESEGGRVAGDSAGAPEDKQVNAVGSQKLVLC